MSVGAIYGGYRSIDEYGTIWSLETLKFAIIGGVGGAVIGAAIGSMVYLGPHLGNFVMSGRSYYMQKILNRHSTSEALGGLGFLMGFYQGLFEETSLFSSIIIPTATLASYTVEYTIQSMISNLPRLMLGVTRSNMNAIKFGLIRNVQSYTFIGTYFMSGYCAGYLTGSVCHLILGSYRNSRGPIREIIGNSFTLLDQVNVDDVYSLVDAFEQA
jgi:hypothetical protein